MAALHTLLTFVFFSFVVLDHSGRFVNAQALIPPARFDGFVCKNLLSTGMDSIIIEAFLDPTSSPEQCYRNRPDKHGLTRIPDAHVIQSIFPSNCCYHDNAFVSSRALHIVNKLKASATYDLLELFFKRQEGFYSQATFNMSKATIVSQIVNLATTVVGNSYQSAVASGFTDRKTDLMTRVSFKYGCSRGVFGAPFFFVNGFALADGDSTMDYAKWRSIIDPLLKEQAMG
ncbi:hypothetical protein RHSIM_Rhsim07G0249300 [Rhododendron simsii]|uniref:Thioredoxin-like fold domain-containing protein n=1 Tax=Rhododendron simsii TaxID=118357 RepID=A0A834LJU8_RHOSS|nr:hypothetical protein RHSIM_Rhsim07G0249300 [Rhododendron simsii]